MNTRDFSAEDDPTGSSALIACLRDILCSPSARDEGLPDVLRDMNAGELYDCLWAVRTLALSLSRGELDTSVEGGGMCVGALKELQANLRHLTWQTRRIADGQYEQQVYFLGEFSTAFNAMTARLRDTVEELQALAAKYKNISAHDLLTGLYNRMEFLDIAVRMLCSESCRHSESTLVMCDVDFFKQVNDTHGHLCGDEVLRRIARILQSGLRPQDVCCRYGGEEFLILLPGVEAHTGKNVAERLRVSAEEQIIPWQGEEIRVTASFGVCPVLPAERGKMGRSALEHYISQADACLYQAKSQGRNRVVHGNALPPQE